MLMKCTHGDGVVPRESDRANSLSSRSYHSEQSDTRWKESMHPRDPSESDNEQCRQDELPTLRNHITAHSCVIRVCFNQIFRPLYLSFPFSLALTFLFMLSSTWRRVCLYFRRHSTLFQPNQFRSLQCRPQLTKHGRRGGKLK